MEVVLIRIRNKLHFNYKMGFILRAPRQNQAAAPSLLVRARQRSPKAHPVPPSSEAGNYILITKSVFRIYASPARAYIIFGSPHHQNFSGESLVLTGWRCCPRFRASGSDGKRAPSLQIERLSRQEKPRPGLLCAGLEPDLNHPDAGDQRRS